MVESLGFGAVIVTILITLHTNASNNADMANALGDMRDIAGAMKNEAAAIADQRPIVERQANAAADAAKAAKDTAEAAKGQTTAINNQAKALIDSARSSSQASSVQLAAAQAEAQAAAAVSATAVPTARFAGVRIEGLQSNPNKDGLIEFNVYPLFVNSGSVAIIPKEGVYHVLFADKLPKTPLNRNEAVFGGNELSVSPNGVYSLRKTNGLTVSKAMRDDLMAGKLYVFIWKIFRFSDTREGAMYSRCFVARVAPANGSWTELATYPISAAAYCNELTKRRILRVMVRPACLCRSRILSVPRSRLGNRSTPCPACGGLLWPPEPTEADTQDSLTNASGQNGSPPPSATP